MNPNAMTLPVVIDDLQPAPFHPAYSSRMWFFDATLETPDGWVTIRRNKAFRHPSGTTRVTTFYLAPHFPDHPDTTEIISIPAAWAVAIEHAVSEAIDVAERQAVA